MQTVERARLLSVVLSLGLGAELDVDQASCLQKENPAKYFVCLDGRTDADGHANTRLITVIVLIVTPEAKQRSIAAPDVELDM